MNTTNSSENGDFIIDSLDIPAVSIAPISFSLNDELTESKTEKTVCAITAKVDPEDNVLEIDDDKGLLRKAFIFLPSLKELLVF